MIECHFTLRLFQSIHPTNYVTNYVVTKIEKYMLRWFGHVDKMDERRLTEEIYEADVDGNAGGEDLGEHF
jgi:hypothetical protein